ncbi:MAG TPA: hypothetical protein VIK86_07345 [Candidatus Paceibacterota bacterium]
MLLLNLIGYGVICYTLIIIVFFFVTEKLVDREKKSITEYTYKKTQKK